MDITVLLLLVLVLVLVLVNLAISAYAFYKIRRIHLAVYRIESSARNAEIEAGRLFAQYQAYYDLVRLIAPRKPLPPLRGWAASPDFLLQIASQVLSSGARTVVECSSGASTLVLARCCELNDRGHVFSLEHDLHYAENTRALLREQGLTDWATVIYAPLVPYMSLGGQHWYSLENLHLDQKTIDLLVIDGPPWHTAPLARYPALPVFKNNLASDCVIIIDDANRDEEKEMLTNWAIEFPEFEQSFLSTEKGCAMMRLRAALAP